MVAHGFCVATDVAARAYRSAQSRSRHSLRPAERSGSDAASLGSYWRVPAARASVFSLVPPSRRRRAEMLLNLAGTDAVWGSAPTVEEIRVLDQQRMLQDTLFTEESTEDDLTLARAMLAERSAEEIAAALARLYRSRLPSPEDVQDPGTFRGREDRPGSRRRDEEGAPVRKTPKKSEPMGEGAKWFRVAIGRQKNAEARWLLPMICRRGGIEKADIGAIKIYDGNSEFEISAAAAGEVRDHRSSVRTRKTISTSSR